MNNRVVVVTGGGSGIGEALCQEMKAEGARHVVVVDRNGDEAQRVANDVGGTAEVVDVSSEQAIVDLVARTEAAHGPIDVFCSNAGFVSVGGLEEPDEIIEAMWDVHVKAHIYAARAVLPSMIAQGEGYLLNTASAAGLLAQVGSLAYTVTKHASVALAEWLSITHHHQGIGVSVLCPQAVATKIIENAPGGSFDPEESLDGNVAAADGVLDPRQVARDSLAAMAEGRFHVLPHPEVGEYVQRKGTDIDRWLGGMRRFQSMLHPDGPLPGDAIAPPSMS